MVSCKINCPKNKKKGSSEPKNHYNEIRKNKDNGEQMNQKNDTIKSKKWKHLSEKERYAIEALFKSNHNARQIAQSLNRDRRTIQREIKRGMVIKVIENPYVSRNPKIPDYLEKKFTRHKKDNKEPIKRNY